MEKIKDKRELIAILDKINNNQDIKKEIRNIGSGLSKYFNLDEFYQLPFPVICKIIIKSYESPDVYKTIVARCSAKYPKDSPKLIRYLPIVDMSFEQCISIIGSFSCSPICMKLKELHLEDLSAVNPDISYAISQMHKDISEIKNMQKQFLEKGKEKEISHEEHIHDSSPPKLATTPLECTFYTSGRIPMTGDFYQCLTCGGPDSQAICPACAQVCHRGHKLQMYHGSYFCDCGAHDLFHCQLVPEKLKCTFEESGRSPIRGQFYQCLTLLKSGPDSQAICPACAKVCHKGHHLVESFGSYFCDCGAHDLFSCKLVT